MGPRNAQSIRPITAPKIDTVIFPSNGWRFVAASEGTLAFIAEAVLPATLELMDSRSIAVGRAIVSATLMSSGCGTGKRE